MLVILLNSGEVIWIIENNNLTLKTNSGKYYENLKIKKLITIIKAGNNAKLQIISIIKIKLNKHTDKWLNKYTNYILLNM